MRLMKPAVGTGIVGYGSYIPQYRIPASEIARVWKDGQGGVPITEKAVPGPDEDTMTIVVWGTLAVIIGIGFAAFSEILADAAADPAYAAEALTLPAETWLAERTGWIR